MNHQEQVQQIATKIEKAAIAQINSETGYEAGRVIYQYFVNNTDHPHAKYTFDQAAMERDMSLDNTIKFAEDLAKTMSHLVATNEIITK